MDVRRGWRNRGHLPHADFAGMVQAITFRLGDALPASVIERLRQRVLVSANAGAVQHEAHLRTALHDYLDAGHGSCILADDRCRVCVADALHKHDGQRYDLLAYCIMPNHVHVLAHMRGASLAQVLQSWKGASGRRINQLRGNSGPLWQREYFDRFIRDENHLQRALSYIVQNPVKAGLGVDWSGLYVATAAD